MVSAWYCDLGSGLLATLVSKYLFLFPTYGLLVNNLRSNFQLALFIVEGVLLSSLLAALQAAWRQTKMQVLETQRYQESLRQNQERYHWMAENVKDYAIFWLDPAGCFTAGWNVGAESILGYQEAEIIGQPFSCLFTPEDIQSGQPECQLRIAVAKGRVEEEGWHVRKNGTQFWASGILTALRDEEGNLRGFSKILRDLTERKQAEAALKESEERFHRAILDAPYPSMIHVEDGEVLQISKVWTELTGYDQSEIFTIADWVEKAYGRKKDLVKADIDRLYNLNARVKEGEHVVSTSSGETRIWDFSSAPLGKLSDGRRLVISMAVDITERKQAEGILRKNEQTAQAQVVELAKLNRLKDDFLSTVSHELRTPVTNMKLAIQMLALVLNRERTSSLATAKSEAELSSAARYLQILQDECEREINLLNDLLNLQRLDTGLHPLVLETIQLQDLILQVVEPFQERVQSRQQILLVNISAKLPPLISDASCLQRIVAELLNNACKYTPPGKQITIAASAKEGRIQLSVNNSGIEISVDELPHIFERFYRIPQADQWQQGGTGLGLALVQKLVEYLAGSIQVDSADAQTCFTVEFPLSYPLS